MTWEFKPTQLLLASMLQGIAEVTTTDTGVSVLKGKLSIDIESKGDKAYVKISMKDNEDKDLVVCFEDTLELGCSVHVRSLELFMPFELKIA